MPLERALECLDQTRDVHAVTVQNIGAARQEVRGCIECPGPVMAPIMGFTRQSANS